MATVATLLATAKMNQVNPHAWLTQTPRAHRQWLAKTAISTPYVLELPELHGLSCPLTVSAIMDGLYSAHSPQHDTAAFEAIRQSGFNTIGKMGNSADRHPG